VRIAACRLDRERVRIVTSPTLSYTTSWDTNNMLGDERSWAVKQLLSDYLKSPTLRPAFGNEAGTGDRQMCKLPNKARVVPSNGLA
jgi:hypothetical protein